MWWRRILHKLNTRSPTTIHFLDFVVSPSESHSAKPFRVRKYLTPTAQIESALAPTRARVANKRSPIVEDKRDCVD